MADAMLRWKSTLVGQIFLASVLVVTLALVSLTVVFLASQQSAFQQELESRASALASFLASQSAFPLLVSDPVELGRIASGALAAADVIYVEIQDSSGRSVAGAGKLPAPPDGGSDCEAPPRIRRREGRGRWPPHVEVCEAVLAGSSQEIAEWASSTPSQRLGVVRLGLSAERQMALRRWTVSSATAVAAGSWLLVLTLQFLWQRRLLRPLGELVDYTRRIGRGELHVRAPVGRQDEIGWLAAAFNEMAAQIRARDAALRDHQNQLERAVAERTAELVEANRRLTIARDQAEAANRAKSAFLANTSHELRTPLNAIIGYAEMLEEDAEQSGLPELVTDLRRIQAAARHLLALINDLLDLAKIEAGRLELRLEAIPAGEVVQEAIAAAAPLVARNRNRLETECDGGAGQVRADRTRLRQCLLNLLSNAAKFTEDGAIRVVVTRERNGTGDGIAFRVQDTGIGIPLEDQERIFESFHQLDSSHTRKHEGTGLGLAITRQLCQLMGGEIRVQSEPGKGSTFTIWLPACGDPGPGSDQLP
jgi:signal transduction histidine kinase